MLLAQIHVFDPLRQQKIIQLNRFPCETRRFFCTRVWQLKRPNLLISVMGSSHECDIQMEVLEPSPLNPQPYTLNPRP